MYQSYSSCQCHEARVHHDIDGVHKQRTRPPHHISIYPIHPVPKGHPCAPRINRLNGHNGRLNEHNRRDGHYGTTRHEAQSKIGPFSQIGAFQTHNWDKCTISILLQKCDTTKGSFFSSTLMKDSTSAIYFESLKCSIVGTTKQFEVDFSADCQRNLGKSK